MVSYQIMNKVRKVIPMLCPTNFKNDLLLWEMLGNSKLSQKCQFSRIELYFIYKNVLIKWSELIAFSTLFRVYS